MTSALRVILCASALCTGVFSSGSNVPTRPPVSASIFHSTTLECKEDCEVRFSDGECEVDMKCLMKNLFRPDTGESVSSKEHSGNGDRSYDKREDEQKCQGKCLFTDKKDNCRLDLICALNRDVEGTLRFLMGFNVDAETAIQLALSATSNDPKDSCNEPVTPSPDPSEGHCCNPSEDGKDCGNRVECPGGFD